MKRLLLTILSVIAFAGASKAQHVYSAGYFSDGGQRRAAVYMDATLLYSSSIGNGNNESSSVVVNPSNQDVYWVRNSTVPSYGDIMKNDEVFLNNYTTGTKINKLYWHDNNSSNDPEYCLFSAGYTYTSQESAYAAVWRGSSDAEFLCPDFGNGYQSMANGICVSGNAAYPDVWYCGVKYTNQGGVGPGYGPRATVWKNNSLMYTLSDINSTANDIAYYNGDVYTCGYEIVGEYHVAKVWKNGSVLYTLGDGSDNSNAFKIKVDGGDVYVSGFVSGSRIIWKNGEILYDSPWLLAGIVVNSEGVYYSSNSSAGSTSCRIFKDNQIIFTVQNCEGINDIFLTPEECTNPQPRQLPYFEGFEMGTTEWACWATTDEGNNLDDQGTERVSYWHRLGVMGDYLPYTGAHCAYHRYGKQAQEGWLISPPLIIPSNKNVELTFQTLEEYGYDMDFEGVMVSTTNPNPNAFQQVWSQSDPSNSWKEVTIDLSAYQGQTIYIAFAYIGTNAHDWYLDDVRVEATGENEYTITTNVNPVGAGTVDGAGTYPAGETVYLTASANPGWQFSHWNDGITTNPRSIIVNGNATYTANFLQQNYTLTVNASPAEGGTVTGGGSYHYGDVATLTATANNGFTFISWSDGNVNATRTVTVTGNATYTALFNAAGTTMYTVTVLSDNPLLGSVSGGGTYPEGAVIQITATPNLNARFVSWDDGNTDNPRDVIVTGNMTFHAIFAALQHYTITVESANPTMGTATGGGSFLEGTTITISATPYSGYYFTSWDDGNADNPRTITVTQNATYKAQFSANAVVTYTLTVICNNAEGTVIGGGTYTAGATATIAAIPNSGYEFDKWSDGSSHNPRQVIVNDNMVFVAFFKGTGVDEGELNPMTLYPNPAKESIHILGIEANSTIEIYNSLGMLVKVVNAGSDQEIGVSDLASGLYLVRCGNRILRFIKQQ